MLADAVPEDLTRHLHLSCAACGRLSRPERLARSAVEARFLEAKTKFYLRGQRGGIRWTDPEPASAEQARVLRDGLRAALEHVDGYIARLEARPAAFEDMYSLDSSEAPQEQHLTVAETRRRGQEELE